jgi:peptidoglycan/LPS O-acetylase OafA/YrhL
LAAVAVFLVHLHLGGKILVPEAWWPISAYGAFGVDLFFVLSAFSLLYTNERQLETDRCWKLKPYAIKRFFRIAPLFYFMLLVHCGLILGRGGTPELSRVLINLLFVFNFIPKEAESMVWAGWSIGVEAVFYLLLPLLVCYARSFRSALLIWLLAMNVSAVNHLLVDGIPALKSYSYFSFLSYLGVFCAGIMGYRLFESIGRCQPARQRRLDRALLFGPALLAFFIFTNFVWELAVSTRMDIQAWGLAFGITTVLLARHPTGFLSHPVFQYLGERSYSIYLTHAVVISLIYDQLHQLHAALFPTVGEYGYAVCAMAAFPVVLMFSEMTYRFIERPGILLGRRLLARDKTAGKPPLVAGVSTG